MPRIFQFKRSDGNLRKGIIVEKEIADSIYIQTMRFAEKNEAGFSRESLLANIKADATAKEIISKYFESADLNSMTISMDGIPQATRETIFIRISSRYIDDASTPFYILTSAAYFDYLAYIELTETRQSAKSARTWSFIALVVSICSALASIGVQMTTKTIIDENNSKP